MREVPKLQPGGLLGERYRIVRLLGQGGMGAVFLAEDVKLPGKNWAVKEVTASGTKAGAFVDEARFLAECSHPGLASVGDFLPPGPDGKCYLVMEYIEGETLEAWFRRECPFPWEKAVLLALELCGVLAYLHEGRSRPIIHRDLKPSNIMLDSRGRIKLIDFGTARQYNDGASRDTMLLGTLGFAAPEQLAGRQTDARTDLYSLGALLYYLLSGGEYYARSSAGAEWAALRAPEAVTGVLSRLLEERPDKRFQRAADAAAALRELLPKELLVRELGSPFLSDVNAGSGKKLIVVGGLTGGSGASFVAAALSKVLAAKKVLHSVVELPGVRPDLFHALFGDRHGPRPYTFLTELIRAGSAPGCLPYVPWRDGATEWVPLPPGLPEELASGWSSAHTEQLLSRLESPAAIVDVGAGWGNESVRRLCKKASAVLLVCGPSPVHLGRAEASRNWQSLSLLREAGAPVYIVANRSVRFAGREEWLRSLPDKPLCELPEIPSEEMLSAQWSGILPAANPRSLQLLTGAMKPLVKLLEAAEVLHSQREKSWSPFRRAQRV